MKRWDLDDVLMSCLLLLWGVLFVAALSVCGCGTDAGKKARDAAEVGAYGAALQLCVETSTTMVEYEQCEAKVDKQFGVKK